MTPRHAKSIATFLSETDTETPVVKRVKVHAHWQTKFVGALTACGRGELQKHSRVAGVDGTTLVVAAANAACAAILKQIVPRLQENFRQDGLTNDPRKSENQMQEQEVTAIRVVLQPDPAAWKTSPAAPAKPRRNSVPMDDLRLDTLAAKLTDSPLKETVLRIQKKRKQALAQKK